MKSHLNVARKAKKEIMEILATVSNVSLVEGCKVYEALIKTEKDDVVFYKALVASLNDLHVEMTKRGMEV